MQQSANSTHGLAALGAKRKELAQASYNPSFANRDMAVNK